MKKLLKNKKILTAFLVTVFICAILAGILIVHHVRNGWKEKDGVKVYKVSGKNLTGINEVEGKTYLFADDGAFVTGWTEYEGVKYYQDDDGLYTGEKTIDGTKYNFEEDGRFFSSFFELDGKKYYRTAEGYAVKGGFEYEGRQYMTADDGTVFTGWASDEGPFYSPDDAAMVKGLKEIEGKTYFFDNDGKKVQREPHLLRVKIPAAAFGVNRNSLLLQHLLNHLILAGSGPKENHDIPVFNGAKHGFPAL